jgi:hypothetical protein
VETTPSYGWRTNKTLVKWFRKNHDDILGMNEKSASGKLGASLKELAKYRNERIKDLMKLPKEALLDVVRTMSKARLERRYRSRHFEEKDFAPTELAEERDIKLKKREIDRWVAQSKKTKKRKKAKVVVVEKVKPMKRRKLRTSDYIRNITRFNEVMSRSVSNIAGLEG